jgi:phosphatidylinositol-bisphosphatase
VVKNIQDVRVCSAGVGMMGVMGNKGGVSARMMIFDTSFCFVCSHLAAHRENVAGRNSDYRNILEKTIFDRESRILTDWEKNKSSQRPKYGDNLIDSKNLNILEHNIIFWLGDLNYRNLLGILLSLSFKAKN